MRDPNLASWGQERAWGGGGCLSLSYELGQGPQGEGGRSRVRVQFRASRSRERAGGCEIACVCLVSLGEGCKVREGGAL